MIDHIEIGTRSLARATRFYADVLAPLGYSLKIDEASKGFGANGALDLFLIEAEPTTNVHFAFAAPSRAAVDECWKAGQDNGHQTDREPALAPLIHPNYYAGYLRDPDGHLIEFVCQTPEQA
jgi:catechol 2,3-dioxygenase-like lactoylglutathione lyase family enzyme